MGHKFWNKLKKKLDKKEEERRNEIEKQKMLEKQKMKREKEQNRKLDDFEVRIREINIKDEKAIKKQIQPLARVRKAKRRASDGLIDVVFKVAEFHKKLPVMIARKEVYKERYPFENPVSRVKHHYSFILDSFPFKDTEGDLLLLTKKDKGFDFAAGFAKLLGKQKDADELQEKEQRQRELNFHRQQQKQQLNAAKQKQQEGPAQSNKASSEGDSFGTDIEEEDELVEELKEEIAEAAKKANLGKLLMLAKIQKNLRVKNGNESERSADSTYRSVKRQKRKPWDQEEFEQEGDDPE